MFKLFKFKDQKSTRLDHFYEDNNGLYKFEVLVGCFHSKGKLKVELESVSTHHYVKYKCGCGEVLKLAPVDFMYESDEIQFVNGNIQARHAVRSIGGVKILRDKIYTSFWELG